MRGQAITPVANELTERWCRCGNVASILELDEHLGQEYKVFSHAALVSWATAICVVIHITLWLGRAIRPRKATAC